MSFFSKEPAPEFVLLVDVQSALVRASIVRTEAGKIPTVVSIHTIDIPYKPHTGSGYLIKTTLRAAGDAIAGVLRQLSAAWPKGSGHSPKISAAHFILSSPWIVSQAKTLSINFPRETKMTEESARKMIETERAKLIPAEQAAGGHDELSVIEEKVFDVRLNGYSVEEWQGKTAQNVDISFVISVAGSRIIERFTELCEHYVPARKIHFHSSLLLQNIGIQKIMPQRAAYTLIHVHGELTDVVVVNHHSCIFFGSYPLGIRGIIRKIAASTKTDQALAESSLSLYVGKQLDSSHAAAISRTIEQIGTGWTAEFSRLFKHEELPLPLPTEAFISARGHDDFFLNSFQAAYPAAKVSMLSLEEILPHVSFSEKTEKLRLLGLHAVALNSMMQQ